MKTKTLNLEKLKSEDPKVKYGFTKELLKLGKDKPDLLYDYFGSWVEMMRSDNNIFKWTAIDLIGYLSAVDKENKTVRIIENLLDLLHSGNLITSNHAIFALGLIAKNKPEHRTRIIKELVTVSKDKFETEECKNIAIGKVVVTLNDFVDDISGNKKVMAFIKQAQQSTRNATKKKADNLMKKLTDIR
jgi:hypothetical protein